MAQAIKHKIRRSLVAGLLATTCLTPLLIGAGAWADGGRGGQGDTGVGGAGGTGFVGNAGGSTSGATFFGAGGAGGTSGSPDGQDGTDAAAGGGGGWNGDGAGAATITNAAPLAGGNGGTGRDSGGSDIGGGGGGAGGYGAVVTGSGTSSNTGSIAGGTGGSGGLAGFGGGGGGGGGGFGVQFTASGATFVNSGSVVGGNGGAGGIPFGSPFGNGANGAGGVGVAGAGLTIVNSGTISGGLAGDGVTRANAITFTGGTNSLELQSGAVVTGNVVAFSTADSLILGGTGSASFDASLIGTQYTGFGVFQKTGAGSWTLTGTNAGTMSWTVGSGTLSVNGSMANSSFAVNSGGTLGGSGTVGATTVNSGGIVAPGNSIGTLTVSGNYTQNAGSFYNVETNGAGASDRINVTGTATINGGMVSVVGASGTYARSTTYTILNATGGVTGTYAGVTSNFAFLTPSLSYDANNVFLTLLSTGNAFADGAWTANQRAVGTVLDRVGSTASGDLATVINALYGLSTAQGPEALNALSGQNYSAFGTANLQSGLLFMQAVGAQLGSGHGAVGGTGSTVALARACDLACDGAPSPWTVWASGLGGVGSVGGDGNSATMSYTIGGAAMGIDYRLDPRFMMGIGVGYANSTQWMQGFDGRGTSDSYHAALYASFTDGGFYTDAAIGYGYADNQMRRVIAIPGLATRNAFGRTGAHQLNGQIEAGYKIGLYEAAAATLTPFARLQGVTSTQAAFTETGAGSLNLAVAHQRTESLRTTLGGEIAGRIGDVTAKLRLGWVHEHADTARPVTASFAGAPGLPFTVQGAIARRDSALVGVALDTAIAAGTKLYLRYDGELGGGSDSHALTAGLRVTF